MMYSIRFVCLSAPRLEDQSSPREGEDDGHLERCNVEYQDELMSNSMDIVSAMAKIVARLTAFNKQPVLTVLTQV